MTEFHQEPAAAGEIGPAPLPFPPPQAGEGQSGGGQGPGWRQVAIGLSAVLLAVAVLVGTAPLWAPALPWGAAPARKDAAPSVPVAPPPATQSRTDEGSRQRETATIAALDRLDRRVAALEARPVAPAGDIADIRQQVAKLSSTVADLAARLEATDEKVASQASSASVDTALVLALLQIRGAVEAGRPFAAEYEAFAALTGARPDIAKAAAPLAGPAKAGVAGRAVLAERLSSLANAVATAKAPAAAPGAATDWAAEALSRLRGLIRVRRIGGAAEGAGPEAAVKAAEAALAGGDLAGAVAKLDGLSGAPADAADPWLRMAKERLAVEATLGRIEAELVTELGAAAKVSAGSGPPR